MSRICLVPALGKLMAFTNNGSLFSGRIDGDHVLASEAATLRQLGCEDIAVLEEVQVGRSDLDA